MANPELLNPERWLAEHGDTLFRYALSRLCNTEQAEDMVQETLLAALESREKFEGRASERNWLMGIAKHKIVDLLRQRYREQPASDLERKEDEEGSLTEFFDRLHHWKRKPNAWADPYSALENKEFLETLLQCVEALPERWAKVFQLRAIDQFSLKEVCRVLDVTSINLGVLLHRARLRVRQCLAINWFE